MPLKKSTSDSAKKGLTPFAKKALTPMPKSPAMVSSAAFAALALSTTGCSSRNHGSVHTMPTDADTGADMSGSDAATSDMATMDLGLRPDMSVVVDMGARVDASSDMDVILDATIGRDLGHVDAGHDSGIIAPMPPPVDMGRDLGHAEPMPIPPPVD